MAGRAGRPKYDVYGEAIIISRSQNEAEAILDRYIHGSVENLISRLASERALRTHVLALVASGFSKSFNEVMNILKNTLFGHQQDTDEFKPLITRILGFLMNEGMIVQNNSLKPTRFGKRVSDLYIDPISAVIIRDGLLKFTRSIPTLSALI